MAEAKETKATHVTLEDLINLEKATRLICQRYENGLRKYDGSINVNDEDFRKFDHFNNKHLAILDALETEVDKWAL